MRGVGGVRRAAVAVVLALSAASTWAWDEPAPLPRPAARQACHAVSRWTCEVAHALGRGVNLGNALDAPREGDWGLRLEPALIDRATRHFQTVRLPVRWSNHASADAQARLDEGFARRVDTVIDRLLAGGGFVILDMHHYTQLVGGARHPHEFAVDPAVAETRMVNLWRQIAARYRDRPPRLLFELLNEPQGEARDAPGNALADVPGLALPHRSGEAFGAASAARSTAASAQALGGLRWNRLAARALAAVRETNPERVVLIGPDDWNHPRGLARLRLPPDRHLIVAIHSYDPFDFTHQGVPWRQPVLPLGRPCCDAAQRGALREALDTATAWSRAAGVPLHLGEFGAYREAPMESRAAYARMVREEAEARGIGWAWWEFASDFSPVWDASKGQWVEPLARALGIAADR